MPNANVEIVLDTNGNVESKMNSAAVSVESLNARVINVGESFRRSFENLPSLLSGGGIEGAISGLGSSLTGLGESAASSLSEFGAFGAAVGIAVGAAAAAAAAFIGLGLAIKSVVEPQMEMIDAAYKSAAALAIPVDQLMSLEAEGKRVAGVAGEYIANAFDKMAKNIGNASEKGGEAEKALAAIGLRASELKGVGLDQAFATVADHIARLSTVSDQAAAATAVFGREGVKLLPLLREGAGGLAQAHDEALKYGIALDSVSVDKIEAAHAAFEELQERISGVENVLTATLAPAILGIGDKIIALIPTGNALRDDFVEGLHDVASAVAYVIDGWQLFRETVLILEGDAADAFQTIVHGADDMVHAVIAAVNKIPHVHIDMPTDLDQFAKNTDAMVAAVHADVNEQITGKLATDKVDDFFKGINDASDKAAAKLEANKGKVGDAIVAGINDGKEKLTTAAKELERIMAGAMKSANEDAFRASDRGKALAAGNFDFSGITPSAVGGVDAQIQQTAAAAQSYQPTVQGPDAIGERVAGAAQNARGTLSPALESASVPTQVPDYTVPAKEPDYTVPAQLPDYNAATAATAQAQATNGVDQKMDDAQQTVSATLSAPERASAPQAAVPDYTVPNQVPQVPDYNAGTAATAQSQATNGLGQKMDDAQQTANGALSPPVSKGLDDADLGKVGEAASLGAGDAQLEQLAKLLKAHEAATAAARDHNKEMEEAKKIFQDNQSPVEKYNDAIVELNKLFAHGAIDKKTYDRAQASDQSKEQQELKNEDKKNQKDQPDLHEDFHAETRRFAMTIGTNDGKDKSAEILNKHTEFLSSMQRDMKDMRNKIVSGGKDSQVNLSALA